MKLVAQSHESWQYHLNHREADILVGLVEKFPFTAPAPARISKTLEERKTKEREKLLNESLAEHRKELTKLAGTLLGNDQWKKSKTGRLLTLNPHSREVLLQILNDIRIGCWHALGMPEVLELDHAPASTKELGYRNLMDLAGYFEMSLLEPEA